MMDEKAIESAYSYSKEAYGELGVDTDEALKKLDQLKISLHCWQADDVRGFEAPDTKLGGGIQVTGSYPGRARTIAELRDDIEMVVSLLPGKQRLNLHAIYGDFRGKQVDRDQIDVSHFQSWIDWARKLGIGLDFNPTCFSHPFADDGFTLSSLNERYRRFWIEHVKRTRQIAAEIGKQLGSACVNNIWIPDGSKDSPVDRNRRRAILKQSLDEIFADKYPAEHLKDSLEGKLFGLGVEAMTVGSHEFYLGYAVKNRKIICYDMGHFHPTEQVGDKISAALQFLDEVLVHISRGVHWDSDHVVIMNDDVQLLAQEIVRADALQRVHVALDYFDASINRIGAYVVGARAAQLAFLFALLEPTARLREYEEAGRNFERLALLEVAKTKPFGAVYDYYCMINDVPVGQAYIEDVSKYESDVLLKRGS
ncbi:MAG: L-rhamnose isomerase [Ignavibacteriae bacterium 37-53-5]|nr:MAG: L-rhamnose isomerase [Ignavibacteriae bacterium 37-53-5]